MLGERPDLTTPRATTRLPLSMPILAACTTVLLWGSAFVVVRPLTESFSPAALTLGRLALGALVLGGVLLARRGRASVGPATRAVGPTEGRSPWRSWAAVAVYGLVWFGGHTTAINAAEQTLDAGTTALLVNLGPLLIALGGGLFLGEGFPRLLFGGMLVALAGVGLIALSGDQCLDRAGVLLAETPTLAALVGGTLCLTGVYLARRR